MVTYCVLLLKKLWAQTEYSLIHYFDEVLSSEKAD